MTDDREQSFPCSETGVVSEESVLSWLRDLAAPSKFLITSRVRPPLQAGIHNYPLSSLTPDDMALLLLHHAREADISEIILALIDELDVIYKRVGGNPLALKLIVNLASYIPLAQIVTDLTQAHLGEVRAMYTHIYRQTWQTLSESAQRLLKTMPLTSSTGGTQSTYRPCLN